MTSRIPRGTIFDGEIIISDKEGKPDFEELMSRFQVSSLNRIHIMSKTKSVTFCTFDVLYYKGKKVTHLPLTERKEILNSVVPEDLPLITKTLSINGSSSALFDLVKGQGLEGIVLKKKDFKYEIGKRSQNWLKVINYQYATVEIAGYRKSEFGWLLRFPNGESAGVMELVPTEARKIVYQLAEREEAKESNDYVFFSKANGSVKCKVKYRALSFVGS